MGCERAGNWISLFLAISNPHTRVPLVSSQPCTRRLIDARSATAINKRWRWVGGGKGCKEGGEWGHLPMLRKQLAPAYSCPLSPLHSSSRLFRRTLFVYGLPSPGHYSLLLSTFCHTQALVSPQSPLRWRKHACKPNTNKTCIETGRRVLHPVFHSLASPGRNIVRKWPCFP